MKSPFRLLFPFLLLLVEITGCAEKRHVVSVSDSDLVGTWMSDDYFQPVVLTIQPDLTYDLKTEKAESVSLSGIGRANMMLGLLAAHPTGTIRIDSPSQITFLMKQEDGTMQIQGTLLELRADEIVCVLGDPNNEALTWTRQDDQAGAGQPATDPDANSEGNEKPESESTRRSR